MDNKPKATVTISSGYFDPIHPGHLSYLRASRDAGNFHIVILNSDKQALKKKGYSFLDQESRKEILESIVYVDSVVLSIDEDESIAKTLESIVADNYQEVNYIFCNGGDRGLLSNSSKEVDICEKYGIHMLYGVGGQDKIFSSSELVKRVKND